MLFPGTKWCGKGSNGKDFTDLGDYSFADRCCRDHDRCKYSIGPFESQYHLFNYGFHYVSHCSCDERFRSCLKVADSGAANLVGKIFFNVVKTKCFMFKIDDVCMERSWWGSCLETKRRKRAVFRDPMTY
ncbi:Group 3 secretory phospholipase A2 [Sarcoptes scabiei]|nr:Group 3 secretory phospholipase A2 [Sarcoptes scabiei]